MNRLRIGLLLIAVAWALTWSRPATAQTPFCANPTPPRSPHNMIHMFGDNTFMTALAAQLGFDYVAASNAHTFGLGRMWNFDSQATWLTYRDGIWDSEVPMDAATRAEYDQHVAIRDNTQTDPSLRYWTQFAFLKANGKSLMAFVANMKSQASLDAAITFLQGFAPWSVFDIGFVDQTGFGIGYVIMPANHNYAETIRDQCCLSEAQVQNSGNFTVDQGRVYYRAALRDMIRGHGYPVAGNPFRVSVEGQELHANTPLDHYFNEAGTDQQLGGFGIVPPGLVQYDGLWPLGGTFSAWSTDYPANLTVAGQAGAAGGWFGALGEDRWWVSEPPIGFTLRVGNHAIKLLRAIPNWDNMVGATGRSWNGSTYQSSNTLATSTVVMSRHGKNNKIFVVFRSPGASFPLRAGESVTGVQSTDDSWIEAGSAASHVTILGSTVSLAGSGVVNAGYILTTTGGCSGGPTIPTAPTNLRFQP